MHGQVVSEDHIIDMIEVVEIGDGVMVLIGIIKILKEIMNQIIGDIENGVFMW